MIVPREWSLDACFAVKCKPRPNIKSWLNCLNAVWPLVRHRFITRPAICLAPTMLKLVVTRQQVLWIDILLLEFQSSSPGTCCRLLNHGVHPSTRKILLRKRTTQRHYKRQRKTARILSRKGSAVKIHHTGISTSERMRRSLSKELQSGPKESCWRANIDTFELFTCLLAVANLVKERPIGRMPNDPDDGSYVCPNDMLLGRATSHVPQGPFKETNNPRQRVEFVQKIVYSLWKRWSRDVFPWLIPRKKWNAELQVNDFEK